jgi:hypothetical protein
MIEMPQGQGRSCRPRPGKAEQAMKIIYKPLWKTLTGKNMRKKDLRLQAHFGRIQEETRYDQRSSAKGPGF